MNGLLHSINEWFRTVLMLPPQASRVATAVDTIHYVEISVFTLMAVVYMAAAAFLLIRYRRRGAPGRTPLIEAPYVVALYSLGMFLVFLGMWGFSYSTYARESTAPADAIDVYGVAKQWMWKFSYADAPGSVGVLYVPAGRPVRVVLTSRDVIHSFYLPQFRIKQDVLPGMYVSLWFEADRPGTYDIFCAELCGVGHSRMRGAVVALAPEAYARWRAGARAPIDPASIGIPAPDAGSAATGTTDLVALGRDTAGKYACLNCHTTDGRQHIGPTWRGLYHSTVRLQDGTSIVADPAYLTESMMDPRAKIVAGFPNVMPSYQGQLTPPETAALLEFIKSLREPAAATGSVLPSPYTIAPQPPAAPPSRP